MLSKGQLAIQRWLLFGHICCRTRIIFRQTHLDIARNSYARFRPNSSSGFGGDAITTAIYSVTWNKFPAAIFASSHICQWAWNHFQVCTTRPLWEHLGQSYKTSDQWSWRRCDNQIVTVLSTISDFKDGCLQPYLPTDQNRFRAEEMR